MPPDFFLNIEDKTKNLLEVKAFNRNATPAFDIADFRMYAEEIIDKPYMLHSDYLIFGYHMNENGVVTVKDLWLMDVLKILFQQSKKRFIKIRRHIMKRQIRKINLSRVIRNFTAKS